MTTVIVSDLSETKCIIKVHVATLPGSRARHVHLAHERSISNRCLTGGRPPIHRRKEDNQVDGPLLLTNTRADHPAGASTIQSRVTSPSRSIGAPSPPSSETIPPSPCSSRHGKALRTPFSVRYAPTSLSVKSSTSRPTSSSRHPAPSNP